MERPLYYILLIICNGYIYKVITPTLLSIDSIINFAVLVNPVENDTSNCLSGSWSKGSFSSNHMRTSAIVPESHFICVSARSLWNGDIS